MSNKGRGEREVLPTMILFFFSPRGVLPHIGTYIHPYVQRRMAACIQSVPDDQMPKGAKQGIIQARDATVLEPCRVSGSRRIGGARQGGSDLCLPEALGQVLEQVISLGERGGEDELGAVRDSGLCGRRDNARREFLIAQGWRVSSPRTPDWTRIWRCSRVEDG